MPNSVTEIPAPRVDFIDPRTGQISREWYLFLLNLYRLVGGGANSDSITDLQKGPSSSSLEGQFSEALDRIGLLETAPPIVPPLPAGSSSQVQYNNGGTFGASSNFTYVVGTNTVSFGSLTGSALAMVVQPKLPTAAEVGGTLTLRTPDAAQANTNAGSLLFEAGNGLGTGVGGNIEFEPGTSPGGNGSCRIKSPAGLTVIQVTEAGAGSLLGFFASTPRARPLAYTKTYSVASRVIPNATFTNLATTAATNVVPWGFASQAQADAVATKVNQLGADVLILKQLIVSLVDDSSTTMGLGLNAT